MKIRYRQQRLEKQIEDRRKLVRRFGTKVAWRLERRLNELAIADRL